MAALPKKYTAVGLLDYFRKHPELTTEQKKQMLRLLPIDVQAGMNYSLAAYELGCPKDQVANFLKAGIWLQRKQLEFASAARSCDVDGGPIYIGFGGPRGPGKTFALIAQVGVDDCQRYPGLKVLFLRKVGRAGKEQFEDVRVKVFQFLKHDYRQGKDLTFPNGSRIILGHFKDEKEIDNYLGQEYDAMLIEELTTFSKEKWDNILSCLRTSKEGWRPRVYAAWNWGGVGHAWVKKLFWDPHADKSQGRTKFIRARPYDNKHLDKEYLKFLEGLVGWKRQSWLEGDPNFQAGQFFTTWSEASHVIRAFDERKIVRWVGGLDYGWTHPTVFHLAGEDKEGNLIVLDEHSASKMTIDEHAASIFSILRPRNLMPRDLDFIAAGRDCFSKKEDGTTISDDYSAEGIELVPAEIDRVNGWAKILARLGDPEKGIRPTIFIHERCKEVIGQIPLAQHKENKPEDLEKMDANPEDDSGGDDALECLRNVCATSPGGALKFCKAVSLTEWGSAMQIEHS
jgi:phage terminase large subunit